MATPTSRSCLSSGWRWTRGVAVVGGMKCAMYSCVLLQQCATWLVGGLVGRTAHPYDLDAPPSPSQAKPRPARPLSIKHITPVPHAHSAPLYAVAPDGCSCLYPPSQFSHHTPIHTPHDAGCAAGGGAARLVQHRGVRDAADWAGARCRGGHGAERLCVTGCGTLCDRVWDSRAPLLHSSLAAWPWPGAGDAGEVQLQGFF
eukprot:243826-Chlamydomonas_euryale.AAC.7